MPMENCYDVEACGNLYHIRPEEFLIIPNGEIHTLYAPQTGKWFVFQFDVSAFSHNSNYSGIQSLLTSCLHITRLSHPHIYTTVRQLLLEIKDEYIGAVEFYELSIYSYVTKLLVILGRDLLGSTAVFYGTSVYKQKEYLQKIKNVILYIDHHYTENLTLDTMASYCGFSKFHFSRLFKQCTNSTYYEYLTFRRIKIAEELLAQSNLSVTEIALQSGFLSISTFNRVFKQKKGCTPSEYRDSYTLS